MIYDFLGFIFVLVGAFWFRQLLFFTAFILTYTMPYEIPINYEI